MRIAASVLVPVCLAVTTAGCTPNTSAALVERSRVAMGSTLRVSAWTDDRAAALEAFEQVFAEFTRLERLMSTWISDSDIVRVNRGAGGEPVRVSAEVRDVLTIAQEISEWTGGTFDVTFGALSGLWKFDHDQDQSIPDMREVRRRLPFIDYRAVRINVAAGTVQLARAGMSIHLGGIGKGYAIDRAAAILRGRGIDNFLIQSGGDLYAGGSNNGRAWRLGIQDPRGAPNRIFAEVELSDGAISTSGDYERYFVKNGTRYHHILDPATGEPARGARSVTIVANRAVIADGLATGVFIMGPTAGMALIEQRPDVEGVIVSDRGDVLISAGLRGKLLLMSAPP